MERVLLTKSQDKQNSYPYTYPLYGHSKLCKLSLSEDIYLNFYHTRKKNIPETKAKFDQFHMPGHTGIGIACTIDNKSIQMLLI